MKLADWSLASHWLVAHSGLHFAARLRLASDGLQLISPILPSPESRPDDCEMRSAVSRVTRALLVRSAVLKRY